MNRKWLPLAVACLLAALAAPGAVRCPSFYSDNMVLQRDRPLRLHGWGTPGEKVDVAFAGQRASTAVAADGRWLVELKPLPACGEGRELKINDHVFKDVLVGDVWVCAGQSNMGYRVSQFGIYSDEIKRSANPLLRYVRLGDTLSTGYSVRGDTPYPCEDTVPCKWEVAGPATTGGFSGTAYFFGKEIVGRTGVPVGLVHADFGCVIEQWIPPAELAGRPELSRLQQGIEKYLPEFPEGRKNLERYLAELKTWQAAADAALKSGGAPLLPPPLTPWRNAGAFAFAYNDRIYPITPFPIKGAIWYQGENNVLTDAALGTYAAKMNALIKGWRNAWKQGDFPFYYAQLADGPTDWLSQRTPMLREDQRRVLAAVPNTGMAVTADIALPVASERHPANKQEVGRRLALWALAHDYGKSGLAFSGPLFKTATLEGGGVRVGFDHVGGGLVAGKIDGLKPFAPTPGAKLNLFELAGRDGKWQPAEAVIDNDTVLVSSREVSEPKQIRYAAQPKMSNMNLYNQAQLPASPFLGTVGKAGGN